MDRRRRPRPSKTASSHPSGRFADPPGDAPASASARASRVLGSRPLVRARTRSPVAVPPAIHLDDSRVLESTGGTRRATLRTSCFSRLAVLQAEYGEELPYAGVLSEGFPFRGRRVPFLNYQKGIYKAARPERAGRAVDPDVVEVALCRRRDRRRILLRLPGGLDRSAETGRFGRPHSLLCRSSTSSRPGPVSIGRCIRTT